MVIATVGRNVHKYILGDIKKVHSVKNKKNMLCADNNSNRYEMIA